MESFISVTVNITGTHLLIVHNEGGDEIHFNVIDYSLYRDQIASGGPVTVTQIEGFLF